MAPAIKIRKAQSKYRADILRLLAVQLREHGIAISKTSLGKAIDGVFKDEKRGIFFVMSQGKDIIGVAYMSFVWALEHGGKTAWLEELYVMPKYRGQGYGQKLLDHALAYMRNRGYAAIDLEVETAHKRVETMYRRNKFKRLTRTRWARKLAA